MTNWDSLPDGVTLEMLDQYARERHNRQRRESYARHPERVERQRMTTYTNFLVKHGRVVLEVPPLPWSADDRAAIIKQAERLAGGGV